MYCIKCGNELKEGMKFCTKCGTPVVGNTGTGEPAKTSVGSEVGKRPKAISGNKKVFGIGAVAALIVILVLGSLMKGSGAGFSSPEKAMEAYLDGFSHADFDRMLKAYPDFVVKYNGGKDSLLEGIQSNYNGQFGDYADQGYEFVYKATGHSMLDKDEAKKVEQEINDAFDINVKFPDVATIDYEIIMTHGAETTVSDSHIGGYAVKYKGKWYYFNVF